MNLKTAMTLGRVSNLPTVWTNMMAAIALVGASITDSRTLPILAALTLFYIGGMFLNDAFDAEIDAKERPERPIPSGQVSKDTVFGWGFGLLAAGLMLLIWIGRSFPDSTGMWPAIGGLGLAATIVAYNRNHKGNPVSPVIMGLCRVFVYITTGLCFTLMLGHPMLVGCLLILAYMIGLTYTAKQENLGHVKNLWPLLFLGAPVIYGGVLVTDNLDLLPFWGLFTVWVLVALFFVKRRGPGDIPRAVVSLIAGICLLDALLIASTGQLYFAVVAVGGFVLTLIFQKFISGT